MAKDPVKAAERLSQGLPLSTGQFAALAGVDTKTVANWIRAKKVTSSRTPGGHYLVGAAEVRRVLLGQA